MMNIYIFFKIINYNSWIKGDKKIMNQKNIRDKFLCNVFIEYM